jgi:membrane-associated phospholipid phosphatase
MAFILPRKEKYFNPSILTKERNNFIWFFYPLILFWMAGMTLLILKGYKESFLILNRHYLTWLDFPLFLLTHIGNGLMIISILTMLWTKDKLDLLICTIISVIVSGLTVQFLKINFFGTWDRPLIVFFHLNPPIHYLPNYVLRDDAFPSGHSTTIACVFTIVAFAYRQKSKVFLMLLSLFSILIIYTRVYLGVHFLGDILAGSFLGITSSLLIIYKLHSPIKARISKAYLYPKTSLYLKILGEILFIIAIYVVYRNL